MFCWGRLASGEEAKEQTWKGYAEISHSQQLCPCCHPDVHLFNYECMEENCWTRTRLGASGL